jgi:redox-sensing transcriptional repressor
VCFWFWFPVVLISISILPVFLKPFIPVLIDGPNCFLYKQDFLPNKKSMMEQTQAFSQLPQTTIERFRLYQPLLRLWKYKNKNSLTIQMISEFIGISEDIVYEDFSNCPKWDKSTDDLLEVDSLIDCIDLLLGEKEFKEALLIGIGKLGTSLLKNDIIAGSGLKIVAAFDIDPEKVGTILSGIKVQNMIKLPVFVRQMHLKMALIATTPENAHEAADHAIASGVHVIWNFTPTQIPHKEGIIVQNTLVPNEIDNDYQKILSRL